MDKIYLDKTRQDAWKVIFCGYYQYCSWQFYIQDVKDNIFPLTVNSWDYFLPPVLPPQGKDGPQSMAARSWVFMMRGEQIMIKLTF